LIPLSYENEFPVIGKFPVGFEVIVTEQPAGLVILTFNES
jgi:hypothetical protein